MNYEHTTSEGVAVVTMVQAILKSLDKKDPEINEEKNPVFDPSKYFSRLDWNLSDEVKNAITTAAQNIDRWITPFQIIIHSSILVFCVHTERFTN